MNKWIVAPQTAFNKIVEKEEIVGNAAAYFTKDFQINGKIKFAKLDITARGLYVGYINGKRIGDSYLNPGWCDYRKTIRYQTYEVTDLLRDGDNTIGCIVGDGWFGGVVGLLNERNYEGPTMLWAVLTIETDLESRSIYTDNSWFCKEGAI